MLSQVIIGRASGLGRDWIQAFPSTFLFLLLNIWVWSINHDWRHLLDILVGASNIDPHTQALALFAGATIMGLAIAGAKGMAGILTDLLEGRYWPRLFHLGAVAKRREQAAREAASHRKQWENFCDRYRDSPATNMDRLREEDRLLKLLGRRRYPLDPERIAPTAIGNVQAAAEEHIQRRHGFTPSRVWPHFWLLIPQDTRAELDKARTTTQRTALYLVWCLAFPLSASAVYSTLPWLSLLKIIAGVVAAWIIIMYVVSRVSDNVATTAMLGYILILMAVCIIAIYQQQLSFILVLLAGPVISVLIVRFVLMSRVIRYHEMLVAAFDVHASLIHDALARESAATVTAEALTAHEHAEGRGAATSPIWAWGMAAEYAYDPPWPDAANTPASVLAGLPYGPAPVVSAPAAFAPSAPMPAPSVPAAPVGLKRVTSTTSRRATPASAESTVELPRNDSGDHLASEIFNGSQAAASPHHIDVRDGSPTTSGSPANASAGPTNHSRNLANASGNPISTSGSPTNGDLPTGLVETTNPWRLDNTAQSVAEWRQAAAANKPTS